MDLARRFVRRLDLLARLQVPQPHDAFVASREDCLLSGRVRLLALALPVARLRHLDQTDRLERLKDRHCLPQDAPLEVPHVHNLIATSAHEQLAVLRNVESPDDADVPVENVQALARSQVPHSDLAVVGARDQARATLRPAVARTGDVEDHRADHASVSLEHMRAVTVRSVPNLDDTVC